MSPHQATSQRNQQAHPVRADTSLVAIVPSYRIPPSALSLIEKLSRTCTTLVVDDGSPCTADPVLLEASDLGARVVRLPKRQGIARSLNLGLSLSRQVGASWLLTLDQDTVMADGHVDHFMKFLHAFPQQRSMIGALGAARINVGGHEMNLIRNSCREMLDVPELLQSGTFWNVMAMTELGGFSTTLGMDAIDAEACLRLRESGYRVVALDSLELLHEIGDTQVRRILGREVHATRHSPGRLNAIVINRFRLFHREFRKSPPHAVRTVRRALVNYLLSSADQLRNRPKT